jgi:hypothetical protein
MDCVDIRRIPERGKRKTFKQAVLDFLVQDTCIMAFDMNCRGQYITTVIDEVYRCCPYCFTLLPGRKRRAIGMVRPLFSREWGT